MDVDLSVVPTPCFVLSERTLARNLEVLDSVRARAGCRIANMECFTAINSAVEVDLLGQVNCEHAAGRQISGVGGAADFMRAALLSPSGRSIVAMPSERRGKSCIVPRLEPGYVSIGRANIDWLVTEHGAARLGDLSLDARAEAAIGVAAPRHRAMLADAWQSLRTRM